MKPKIILAIESSCDETAIAVLKGKKLLANVVSSQIDFHQKYGGVMPEIASRLHLENIGFVLSEALEKSKIKMEDVSAIAVTRGPGLIGSLQIGLNAAKTLAMIYQLPLIPVHHLAAHIYANEFVKPLVFPALAVVVSGGNTELIYMTKHLSFEVIGATLDDAIGECFDKCARVLGLPYPGGVYVDKYAKEGQITYDLPSHFDDGTLNVSYSGLKTAVVNLVNNLKQAGQVVRIPDMCASFQTAAIKMLVKRINKALDKYPVTQIVLAGGVSANSLLREEVASIAKARNIDCILPPLWTTTDNGAMIAILGRRLYQKKTFSSLSIDSDANWRIEDFDKFKT
ncbi:MAG: tRNA (adenosine(37)-N6)-threonylcarbamoyltransferase complex transferase subunit TsaD [Erysipelotrichaceae bacterium]|jgi:N6-L-threonylcarbamoyladenine synthase|nr:tRNA (adenosine(37)-N6)-threonylcarbamoyltransferase complex transferase subunit TsaD [Erysipelotrichaceae bacterium]